MKQFPYALRREYESTGKTPVELFLENPTLFQRLIMVSDSENKFMCQDVDMLVKEGKGQIN